MKRFTLVLCTLTLAFCLGLRAKAASPTKAEKRIAYTLKNLKLNEAQRKSITPILQAYLAEIKEAKKTYSALRDKYKTAIDKGTLTDSQAEQLLKAKFAFDIKAAGIRQKYMPKLATAIPYKKVYYCFDFINDKMSKIEGRKSSQDDED